MQQQLKYDEAIAGALDFIKDKLKFKYSSQCHYKIGWSKIKEFMKAQDIVFVSTEACE
ncbi:hypothetical protein ADIARSV_3236 [Arcticibacter svalbardensis MN12-7]|uniref:Uncharacterized protein n=1 Tax=Arcticibacter svalbardensis MN12-7 TaxID=1150600 RepID=R9GP72_9SPHI|nr:hypothetical protein ADIARSV_3236 [Arcticibacter svalbardensis MN12-7]